MKRYLLEIHMKDTHNSDTQTSLDALEVLLAGFDAMLASMGMEIVVSGVAEENEVKNA